MLILIAILAVALLLLTAVRNTWLWRRSTAANAYSWDDAAFYWGVFLLALYLTWPVFYKLFEGHPYSPGG